MKKMAVIGSNSFSGSHCVNYALSNGFDVIGISRSEEPNDVFLPYRNNTDSMFSFYRQDLNKDLKLIVETINDHRVEIVVNFAAQSMVAESWQNPEQWYQTNVLANVKLCEGLKGNDHLKKYVHISTPEVYGTSEELIGENVSYNPSTPYAVSRAAMDMHLMNLYKAYDFPVVFTRAANVYGPGQQLYRIIPRAILCFLTGEKLQLHGGGLSVRSFIHIRDVVEGTLKVAREAQNGEIFHFSTDRTISIRLLVEMIARLMELSYDDNVDIVGERLGKDFAYQLDSSKARETLGWKDVISLEKGIEETIRWVKSNLDVLKKQPSTYIHKP